MTPQEAHELFNEVEEEFGEDKSTEFILSICIERSCLDVTDFCTLMFRHQETLGIIDKRFEEKGKNREKPLSKRI